MEKKAQDLRLFDDMKTEEFVVDDLFDFSNGEEFEDGVIENLENENENEGFSVPVEKEVKLEDFGCDSVLDTQLCIPMDEVANLEWLSQFVEESFSGYPLPVKPTKLAKTDVVDEPVHETPVQTKVRSKRGRTGFRVWSMTSPLLIDSSDTVPMLPPAKKHRQKAGDSTDANNCVPQPARRCNHCGVQKTPQWRAGPTGPKTLCNACGVRYKSGRLLPEYRPACSPTFSSEVHSNNHRKVLEMRKKKEGELNSGLQAPST